MARYVERVPTPVTDAAQPRALIVTIYGLYGRGTPERGRGRSISGVADGAGWLPVWILVRLLAELDVDEPAVRSAISRLKRRGLLVAERRGGVAGYGLSESGDAILGEGDARIFAPAEPRLADGWVLAIFSVPEHERAKRHTLRTQLAAHGFGACAPGVWVAPSHRYELTAASLRRHDLAPYVDLFRAEYLAFGDIAEHARGWWDLDAVRAAYVDFATTYRAGAGAGAVARRRGNDGERDSARTRRAPNRPGDAAAFAAWVRALTAWRRLPYLDPGLPVELLPADWPANAARATFSTLQATLAGPAQRFVATVAQRSI
jgi:phenylacetic acid degradation operon negative regulatory protein